MTRVYQVADPRKVHEPDVPLEPGVRALFSTLWDVWFDAKPGNEQKLAYYNAEQPLRSLGITIPAGMADRVRSRCDWPRMAVDYLANRSVFETFVFAGDEVHSRTMAQIVADNDLPHVYDSATKAELICSPSFMTVSAGAPDEPDVIVRAYSATEAAGLWDERRQRIAAAFTIVSSDDRGEPDMYHLYTDWAIYEIRRVGSIWYSTAYPHDHGRPLIEPLRYRSDTWAPFGHSRISGPVRDTTDEVRANEVYTAVASEFYSAPQRYLLGAPDDIFEGTTKWEAYIGNIFAATRDENGDIPAYGQLPQMTMEPLLARRRELAKQFSGQTGVPTHSLGISSDSNPTSFEAMHMAENDIVIEAERLNRSNAQALENVAKMALAISDGVPLPALDVKVTAKFANPQRPSASQRVDFAMKTAAIYPQYVTSPVFKEDMGWDAATRVRLEEHEKAAGARQMVTQLAQGR